MKGRRGWRAYSGRESLLSETNPIQKKPSAEREEKYGERERERRGPGGEWVEEGAKGGR